MATRNINLTDTLDTFVAELTASGRYQNASEVVRAGLRLLQIEEEDRAAKRARLIALADEAEAELARDEGIILETEEEIEAFFESLGQDEAPRR